MDVAFEWKSHAPKIFQKLNLYICSKLLSNEKTRHRRKNPHSHNWREKFFGTNYAEKRENNGNFQRNAFYQLLLNLMPCINITNERSLVYIHSQKPNDEELMETTCGAV